MIYGQIKLKINEYNKDKIKWDEMKWNEINKKIRMLQDQGSIS